MTTINSNTAKVSTLCECMDVDDETGEEFAAPYCYGCNSWQTAEALDLLHAWERLNDYPDAVIIRGSSIGWQRRNGYALIRGGEYGYFAGKLRLAVLDKLTLDGDFTLTLKLEGNTLTAHRSSHDEYGANFTLEAFAPCDAYSECQAIEGVQLIDGVNTGAACLAYQQADN